MAELGGRTNGISRFTKSNASLLRESDKKDASNVVLHVSSFTVFFVVFILIFEKVTARLPF